MNKLVFYHSRLWTSVGISCLIYFLLPQQWSTLTRVLVCWNCGVGLFLALIFLWMRRLTADQICSRFIEEDESAPIIVAAVTVAAMLSLVAIIEPLATLKQAAGTARAGHMALAALTLVNSWILVPTMFTTHYADLFYSAPERDRPLRFPETEMPIFWDFAYFSFTIAAACQTADVSTLNVAARKAVLAHTLISFLFNASILGFAINVTAGLIGGN
jgi:uncharacterized membrane protein